MRILLTGASGYIGKRLVSILIKKGYVVTCCVRDLERISLPESIASKVDFLEIDFLDPVNLDLLPKNIDGAYYLIHSI